MMKDNKEYIEELFDILDRNGYDEEKVDDLLTRVRIDSLSNLKQWITIMSAYGDWEVVMWDDIKDEIKDLKKKNK